jgi:hypothetical protein
MSTKVVVAPSTLSHRGTTSSQNDDENFEPYSPIHQTAVTPAAAWRKRGENLRASLIEQDEANGMQTFVLSSTCPIQRYYQVADKVRTHAAILIGTKIVCYTS